MSSKTYTCEECGKSFDNRYRYANHFQLHDGATRRIYVKLKRIQHKKQCIACGVNFYVERTVQEDGTVKVRKRERVCCSKRCATRYASMVRTDYSTNTGGGIRNSNIARNCVYCGDPVKNPRTYNEKPYCSKDCSTIHKRDEMYSEAERTHTFVGVTTKPRTVRILLVNKHGHKCSICGISRWRKHAVPLVLDHVNGDSDNWSFDNLRMVCRNCDGLLPTFAGRNIGRVSKQTKRMAEQDRRVKEGRQKRYRRVM